MDPDWSSVTKDAVREHHADKPCDVNGDIIIEEEDDQQPVTRSEMEAHFTETISDKLVGSVIEYDVDGEK